MDKLSVRQAAARFDVSRPTLAKWLKDGTISGERTPNGGWLIDPAELQRKGVKLRQSPVKRAAKAEGSAGGKLSAPAGGLPVKDDAEVSALKAALEVERAKREAAEELAEERRKHIEDLRRMLPPPAAPVEPPRAEDRRPWWKRWR